jgi:uncharacterized delta-60 repeat protein
MWPTFSRNTRKLPRLTSFRPHLEQLEDRCLLSGGVLDPTFGNTGILTTAVAAHSNSQALGLAVYPNAGTANDGKLVAAGYSYLNGDQFTVVRYNLDGSLDRSFGSGGEVTSPSGVANDVKIQPDGKIVAAGWDANNFAVVRYNADGSLDTTFGGKAGKGEVTTDIGQKSIDGAGRLAIQPDGKIVVAGWTAAPNSSNYDLALVRYNADGSLDASFGSSGKVIQHFAYPLSQSFNWTGLLDMAIDPGTGPLDPNAGKIVVDVPLSYPGTVAVVRFNTNGSLDTSFGGSAGYQTASTFHPLAVAVQPDDRVILAGVIDNSTSSPHPIGLARLNPDGTLDASFGVGGMVVTAMPGDARPRSLALQPDGKILVAGNQDYNFMVARYNAADGSLDTSFGVNGVAVSGAIQTPYQPGVAVAYQPVDVALEPDGRIVVAGSQDYRTTGHYSFALARFLSAGPQVGSFTTSLNPAPVGSHLTLSASRLTDAIPAAIITQVAFYVDSNGDGILEPGSDTLLGNSAQTSPGIWALTFTITLTPGTYTLFAQAEDSYGVFGDPVAFTLQVL